MSIFYKKAKKTILFFLFSLTFISAAQARSSTDPCNNAYGDWKGNGHIAFTNGSCRWEAYVNFREQGNGILMTYHYYNNQGNFPPCQKKEGDIIKTMICENGVLSYDTGTGIITEGNMITLNFLDNGGVGESILTK